MNTYNGRSIGIYTTSMCVCVHYVCSYVEWELLPAEEMEETMQKQFVCQQLLSIILVMDLSDEVGKCVCVCVCWVICWYCVCRRRAKMVLDLLVLPGLPIALVTPLLAQQTLLWPHPQHR